MKQGVAWRRTAFVPTNVRLPERLHGSKLVRLLGKTRAAKAGLEQHTVLDGECVAPTEAMGTSNRAFAASV